MSVMKQFYDNNNESYKFVEETGTDHDDDSVLICVVETQNTNLGHTP